jgi:hypothetical protein
MSYRDSDYASASDLKSFARIGDTTDDAQVALAVTSASRAIDRFCGRAFGLDSAAVTRTYRVTGSVATVDDINTTTGLSVTFAQSEQWGASPSTLTLDTDFRLLPLNAGADGKPWTQIELNPSLYCGGFGILNVTAKYGWTAIPDAVKEATLIQASRFLQRRESPFGIAGSPDVNGGGVISLRSVLDSDVMVLLSDYKRRWAAV